MIRLSALACGGGIDPWRFLGLECSGSTVSLADVDLDAADGPSGLRSWTFSVSPGSVPAVGDLELDGISTRIVETTAGPARTVSTFGPATVVGLDHVVVLTPDIDRTCDVLSHALSLEVRRERILGNGAVQRFLKPDNTVIEVVSNPGIEGPAASLWGMVASVDDLEGLVARLGPDAASAPKAATQSGRSISTVRPAVGLGVPFAIMSPHVRGQ